MMKAENGKMKSTRYKEPTREAQGPELRAKSSGLRKKFRVKS